MLRSSGGRARRGECWVVGEAVDVSEAIWMILGSRRCFTEGVHFQSLVGISSSRDCAR